MSSRMNENELLVAAALSKITNEHVITYNDYITCRYGDAITYNKLGLEEFQQICLDHSTNFADHIRPDTHNGATCSHCHALPPLTTLPLLPTFPYLVSASLIGVVAGSTTRGESSPTNHKESEPTNGEETRPTNNEMIIFVKLLNNSTKSFKVFPQDTILSLKQKLEAEEITLMGLMGDYDLVFSGRYLLNDHGTLADYNIDNESTLHLIMKIKGGSNSMSYMDKDLLDPAYDFDFTKSIIDTDRFRTITDTALKKLQEHPDYAILII
ncbi:16135_t:CDS:2 [Entrophospora sp. SA101]|nr:16135_t:CDS:2 [Entrophospora sp. SA101]